MAAAARESAARAGKCRRAHPSRHGDCRAAGDRGRRGARATVAIHASFQHDRAAGGRSAGARDGTAGWNPGGRPDKRRNDRGRGHVGDGVARPLAMKSKEFFPDVFSRHAEAYQQRLEGIMANGEARGRTRVIELAEARPGMRVLDLACGMIDLATRAGIPNARFQVMDLERLDFAGATFDAAVCGHGLQFVPDLARALREARRVLRSPGRLAASVPVSLRGGSAWTILDAVVDRWLPPAPKMVDQQPTRETVSDPRAFRQAALDAGFLTADVEAIDEEAHWESAAQMVSMLMSWWDCASRLEGMDAATRQAFMTDATETLTRQHPGAIETAGRNLVLIARVR